MSNVTNSQGITVTKDCVITGLYVYTIPPHVKKRRGSWSTQTIVNGRVTINGWTLHANGEHAEWKRRGVAWIKPVAAVLGAAIAIVLLGVFHQ